MDYLTLVDKVLAENSEVLRKVDPKAVDTLADYIVNAKQIQLYSMGRCQHGARALTMRLKHMGFDAHMVFDTITPAIGPGDLYIGFCAVNNIELNVVQCAKKAGATIALVTPHPESDCGKLADFCLHLPGQIFGGPQEVPSIQPMASLLEQSLFVFGDILVMMLMEKKKISMQEMKDRHTNLEGLNQDFA